MKANMLCAGGMKRREFLTTLAGAAVTLLRPLGAQAQEAGKVKRIGFLRVGAVSNRTASQLQQAFGRAPELYGSDRGFFSEQNVTSCTRDGVNSSKLFTEQAQHLTARSRRPGARGSNLGNQMQRWTHAAIRAGGSRMSHRERPRSAYLTNPFAAFFDDASFPEGVFPANLDRPHVPLGV
jgi:hypothetical protein